MLRLFGYATSINVRKVLWACAEIGVPFDLEEWGGSGRPTSDSVFLTLNPVGLVPVVDDEGTVIWESNTIVRYLAASRRRDDLLPTEPGARAAVESWMDWQGSDFNNSWHYAFQGLIRKSARHTDLSAIQESAREFSRAVAIINGVLRRGGPYIAGPTFTVADIAIGLSIHRWRSVPIGRPELPHVDQYYARLCERAGFRLYGRDGGP